MKLGRAAIAFLWLPGFGCRALSDDQETRPLPAPEPPPARVAPSRPIEKPRASEPRPARPRAAEAGDVPREEAPRPPEATPSASARTPEPRPSEIPPPQAGAESQKSQCLDACRQSLASCVSAPSAAGDALATCKIAFEACQTGC